MVQSMEGNSDFLQLAPVDEVENLKFRASGCSVGEHPDFKGVGGTGFYM